MTKMIILGTAAALPDSGRENTYMVLQGSQSAILIDCAGSPIQRLLAAGVSLSELEGLILTHHHPDHIYGVPALFLGLWLDGREKPFHIFAPPRTLQVAQSMMELLEWHQWPQRYPVLFHEVPITPGAKVLEDAQFAIFSSPGQHMLPTLSLRIHNKESEGVLTYCCDTEPTPDTIALAHRANILIHECAGPFPGHSSARQAGATAQKAGAQRLVLIHYSLAGTEGTNYVSEAKEAFRGPVELAHEGTGYDF
jgi:ribonuclease Z